MESNMARTISTAVIWTALCVMAVSAMVNDVALDFLMAALFLAAGVLGTAAVWESGRGDSVESKSAEKTKRRARVDRVLERLSEAEVAELRARLVESDGELLTLQELVEEQERRTRGY